MRRRPGELVQSPMKPSLPRASAPAHPAAFPLVLVETLVANEAVSLVVQIDAQSIALVGGDDQVGIAVEVFVDEDGRPRMVRLLARWLAVDGLRVDRLVAPRR